MLHIQGDQSKRTKTNPRTWKDLRDESVRVNPLIKPRSLSKKTQTHPLFLRHGWWEACCYGNGAPQNNPKSKLSPFNYFFRAFHSHRWRDYKFVRFIKSVPECSGPCAYTSRNIWRGIVCTLEGCEGAWGGLKNGPNLDGIIPKYPSNLWLGALCWESQEKKTRKFSSLRHFGDEIEWADAGCMRRAAPRALGLLMSKIKGALFQTAV